METTATPATPGTTTETASTATAEPEAPRSYQSQRFKSASKVEPKPSSAKTETKADEKPESKADDDSDRLPPDEVRKILGKEKKAEEVDEPAEGEKKEAKVEKEPSLYKEKVKAKIDGQEREWTVKELLTRAQKAEAADKRFQEAASIKKQAGQLIKLLQTDPMALLKHPSLGHKAEALREMMEKELYEHVKLEAMDPKERELHELKTKLQVIEDEKKRAAEAAHEQEIKALADKYTTDYQKQIMDALEGGGLPKSVYTVKQMAYYLKQALSKGHRLKATDVVDLVKDDFKKMFNDLYANADGEHLIAMFGEDVADKINKARLAKLKATEAKSEIAEESHVTPKKQGLSWQEWRERNRARNR